jgi:alkylated DNA repair dioxygenase AlkB
MASPAIDPKRKRATTAETPPNKSRRISPASTTPTLGYQQAAALVEKYIVFLPRHECWSAQQLVRVYQLIQSSLDPVLAADDVAPAGNATKVTTRKTGFFHFAAFGHIGAGYTYSGVTHAVMKCPSLLEDHLRKVEIRIAAACKLPDTVTATHFHTNRYEPAGKLGPHCDSEAGMDRLKPIISLSFGSTRTFRVHIWLADNHERKQIEHVHPKKVNAWNRKNPDNKCTCYSFDYTLNHGDVIVMLSGCQKVVKHSIVACGKNELPKITSDEYGGIRHNITLRTFTK